MSKTLSQNIFGVLIILIAGGVSWFLYTHYATIFSSGPDVTDVSEESGMQIPGSLILTLKPSTPDTAVAATYRVPAKGGALQVLNTQSNYFEPALSSDNRISVVSANGNNPAQLYIADINKPDHATPITPPSPALFAGASNWSSDNKYVVYEAITALPSANDISITNSRVVLIDTTTKQQTMIDIGSNPIFMADGSILYLKADGVYRVKHDGLSVVATSTERVIYFAGYEANRTTRLALSHNGQELAISFPDEAGLITYDVAGAASPTFENRRTTVVRALFPTFSPDGKQLAFIEVGKGNDEQTITKGVSVMDVYTFKKHGVLNLDAYSDTYLSLGMWVK